MDIPETKFAKLGQDRIAYQVLGEGPPDLLFLAGMSGHVDVRWEDPSHASFMRGLASFSRLIVFDRRGTGASDPFPLEGVPRWEIWIDDVRAVLDTVGVERAALLAQADAGPTAILFAATEPDRTHALVLANTAARIWPSEDHPSSLPVEEHERMYAALEESWASDAWVEVAYPSMAGDDRFREWFKKYLRVSCGPREASAYMRAVIELDARSALPLIRAPTLVIHRQDSRAITFAFGSYMAEHIPGAKFVVVPGTDAGIVTEGADEILGHIEEFLTGARRHQASDRILATVLFTDIVESTEKAIQLGDRRWKELLAAHDDAAHACVDRYRGRVVKTTGDGLLATFEGPGRALQSALALRDVLGRLGVPIRAGIHVGEIELRPNKDISGIAVHIGARVAALAQPSEVLASSTVRDLVAGSGVEFVDRGTHALKGIPGEWRLFAVQG